MGLFDKKVCDICGEKIGLLGNRKLDDGNLCKDCAKKLSPWFEERRHSTCLLYTSVSPPASCQGDHRGTFLPDYSGASPGSNTGYGKL